MTKAIAVFVACAAYLSIASLTWATGYEYRSGYYWKGNIPHHRYQQYYPGYYYHQGGYQYYQPGYYDYNYSPAYDYQPPAVPPPVPKVTDADWRGKLLELAAGREKANADLAKIALEQKYFDDSIRALGLQGSLRTQYHSGYANPNLGQFGANASTLYGYSYQSAANYYGQVDLNQLYQASNRLAQNLQTMSGEATQDFQGLVAAAGQNQAEVAKIFARAQAAAEILKNLEQPSSKSTELKFGTVPPAGPTDPRQPTGPPPGAQAAPVAADQVASLFEASALLRCASCHGAKKQEGGFDVRKVAELGPEARRGVISRIESTDAALRMPKGADPLPDAERRLWRAALGVK